MMIVKILVAMETPENVLTVIMDFISNPQLNVNNVEMITVKLVTKCLMAWSAHKQKVDIMLMLAVLFFRAPISRVTQRAAVLCAMVPS